jgi:hypothetical protein
MPGLELQLTGQRQDDNGAGEETSSSNLCESVNLLSLSQVEGNSWDDLHRQWLGPR